MLGFLVGIGYNTACWNAPPQDLNLRLEESNLCVVTRRELLEQHPQGRLEGVTHGCPIP